MWDVIKDETGVSEKRKHAPIFINKNGSQISEPTYVAKLFNTYFTEIAGYSLILPLGYLNIPTIIKNLQPPHFLNPQMIRK
jgi:hypothetical protein